MSLLEIKDLQISFRQDGQITRCVHGVSFTVDRGETVALVGESGSGKSVTALSTVSLLGDNAIVSGSVTYDGKEMVGAGEDVLGQVRGNDISFIFQEPMTSLNPLHTLEKQLRESIELHQDMSSAQVRARILELLDRVGIRDPESRLGAYPHQLSGGQRQRVMIAMALANTPDILIADEPTTAVDVTIQAQVIDLMHDLVDEFGMGIIFITHDLAVVAQTSDLVSVMYLGRLMETGLVRDVIRTPAHPDTQGLLNALPKLDDLDAPLAAGRGDALLIGDRVTHRAPQLGHAGDLDGHVLIVAEVEVERVQLELRHLLDDAQHGLHLDEVPARIQVQPPHPHRRVVGAVEERGRSSVFFVHRCLLCWRHRWCRAPPGQIRSRVVGDFSGRYSS